MRELRNVVERAIITSRDGRLRLERIVPAAGENVPATPAEVPAGEILTDERLRQLERQNMIGALDRAGGRVGGDGGAAALLGVSPSTFKSRMKALEIRRGVRGST